MISLPCHTTPRKVEYEELKFHLPGHLRATARRILSFLCPEIYSPQNESSKTELSFYAKKKQPWSFMRTWPWGRGNGWV